MPIPPSTAFSISVGTTKTASPPSTQSLRALDWFVFFVADIQAGFGSFVAAFLTTKQWSQTDIGIALTSGSLIALAFQTPAGALVDAVPAKRLLAFVGVVGISIAALILGMWPTFFTVVSAEILHAVATCIAGPATIAISLGLSGYAGFSRRLARNVSFAALGNAIAALCMGLIGYYLGIEKIFYLTAALGVFAILALFMIRAHEIDPFSARGGAPKPKQTFREAMGELIKNKRLIIFAAAIILFQFGNASMLTFMASAFAFHSPESSTLFVAAAILGPQLIASAVSPWFGRKADEWGRKNLLILAFAPLPIRGFLLAITSDPYLVSLIQLLDGISAALLGILVPLVIADVTKGSGHFNLAQGFVATAVGIGAALSTTIFGYLIDNFGYVFVFVALAAIGLLGVSLVAAVMPETRSLPSPHPEVS